METIELSDYILYGFLAFIGLLLIAMFVVLIRLTKENGEIKGELKGINKRLDELTERVAKLEQTVLTMFGEVGEIKGRLNLMLIHRHEPETGQVILTPEQTAAD